MTKFLTGLLGSLLTGIGTAMADGGITEPEIIAAVGGALMVGGSLMYRKSESIDDYEYQPQHRLEVVE